MKRYTQDEVRDRLHKAAGWKGAYKLAERIGVSQSYLSEVMNGRKAANETILSSIGLETAIIAKRKDKACNAEKAEA